MKKREVASKKKRLPHINIKQIFGSKSTESLLVSSPTEKRTASHDQKGRRGNHLRQTPDRKQSNKQSLKIILKTANLLRGSRELKSSLKPSLKSSELRVKEEKETSQFNIQAGITTRNRTETKPTHSQASPKEKLQNIK